jgi:hypothetical protein
MTSFTGVLATPFSRPGHVVPAFAPSAPGAITARQCFFPHSSWVYAFILTCDNLLAVWFKRGRRRRRHHVRTGGVPGVCCLYPTSNKALYDLAVSGPSAGRFVHRFLYKKLPYQLVQPPPLPCAGCGGCCPDVTLPGTLHVTFTGAVSGSAVLAGGPDIWSGSAVLCGGARSNIVFNATAYPYCRLDLLTGDTGSCVGYNLSATSVSCRPFVAILPVGGQPPGCCDGLSFTATVTT